MASEQNDKKDEKGKKTWEQLKLETLDVPSATQAGMGRLQPGEAFNFYSNS